MPILKYLLFILCLIFQTMFAQPIVTKVEPPNWWVGMKWNHVQLMFYGDDLNGVNASSVSQHVRVVGIESIDNPSYAFITIEIADEAPAGAYTLSVFKDDDTVRIDYPILQREDTSGRHQGFTSADVIYLITPDRFADGDTTNNRLAGMRDGYNPDSLIGRHGGDIQGIIDHLDYLSDLGVTALWMNPMIENDMPISYHGYAATDLYRIDPRFGTNELYKELVNEAHERGLKIILDHVSNHIGIHHEWLRNLPMPDWLNGSVREHEKNRHRKTLLTDVHSDSTFKANTTDGWFTDYMPDLNQRNPHLASYLIQNTLWWIESTGLDGIREDTYPYADQEFLSTWAKAILDEYPSFNVVGEVWIHDPVYIAPYQRGTRFSATNSNLPAVTDFAMFTAFMRVFGSDRADIGVIHECLTKDFMYAEPDNLVTFLDNHDVTRIMSICKGDVQRFEMALTILLTARGIPQIFYGTELGMMGEGDHGRIRQNFPGGFPRDPPIAMAGDPRNAFTPEGRTPQENTIFDFVKKLLAIRKEHKALQTGSLVHFPPKDNVYVYFRILPEESVMIVVNNNPTKQTVKFDEFEKYLEGSRGLRNLMTAEELEVDGEIPIDGNTVGVFEVEY